MDDVTLAFETPDGRTGELVYDAEMLAALFPEGVIDGTLKVSGIVMDGVAVKVAVISDGKAAVMVQP